MEFETNCTEILLSVPTFIACLVEDVFAFVPVPLLSQR